MEGRLIRARETAHWLEWSKNGDRIYYLEYAGNISFRRVRISDGSAEIVHELKDFPLTGMWGGSLTLAPDDSPLLLRSVSTCGDFGEGRVRIVDINRTSGCSDDPRSTYGPLMSDLFVLCGALSAAS